MHTTIPSSVTVNVSHRGRSASGVLALAYCGKRLPLEVLQSARGFYIGTASDDGPCSRESVEYFETAGIAQQALKDGSWSQKDYP